MIMLNSKEIATEILNQLGGNKFLAMTGTYDLMNKGDGLIMRLRRNKANAAHLSITYTSSDLYDMEFYNSKGKLIKEVKGAYNDMLQSIFTNVTGLYTSL